MKTAELRSKEEIKEDIEQTRHQARSQFRRTKTAVVERNPAVLAWQATKRKFFQTKSRSVSKAHQADLTIRSNIYRTIAFAAVIGILAGLFAPRTPKVVIYREV